MRHPYVDIHAKMSDLDRLYTLLTSGTGVIRTRHPDLEREAAERAREARDQVGLEATGTESDLIRHPTQAQCEARLGPEWSRKGVGELATWLYLYNDPIKSAADGLLNSPVHRAVLDNPAYMYWGAGIYTELPAGEPELARRHYVVVWLSKLVPPVAEPEPTFSDVPADHPFFNDVEWAAEMGITAGVGGGKFDPDKPVTRAQMTAFLRRLYRTLDG